MLFEKRFEHNKEFSSTASGLLFSYTIDLFKYQLFMILLMELFFVVFMICLCRIAQQFT